MDFIAGVNVVAKEQTYAHDENWNRSFYWLRSFKSQLCLSQDNDNDNYDDDDVDHEDDDGDNNNHHNVDEMCPKLKGK